MAALFYTNHKMNDVQSMFKDWIQLFKTKDKKQANLPSRAVPAIEIDTELANAPYDNQNEIEQMQNIGDHLDEDNMNQDINNDQQNMIRIEGEDDMYNDPVESSK